MTSCAITPEEEDREELTPALKFIESPKNISVISDCINGRIELSWDEVLNATHYIVEYQSATDYLSDKPMKTYATNSNSFTLSTFPNPNDKRFVFKVRAVSKQSSRILESDYSNLIEGAIVDDFTVNPIIKGSKLSFFSSYPKIASILNSGDILKSEIIFFDGDYTQSDIPSLEEAKTTFDIGSSETKTITAVLISNDKVVKKKSVTVTADVSYFPASIKSFTVENNKIDGVHLNWTSPGINKGLENTEILFLVERALQGTSNWEIIKPTIDEEYFKPEHNNDLNAEHFSMSIIDQTALSNCEYTYRVSTVYKITNGDNVYYSSESITDKNVVSNCYRADSKVKSFVLTNDSGLITNDDHSKSHTVTFKWETFHTLPDDCSLVINRKLINTLSSSTLESTYNTEFTSNTGGVFTDTITISSSDSRDPKSFIYTAYIKYNDGTNTDSPYVATYINNNNQAIISFAGENVVQIIKSLSATNGANAINDKIKLTWEVESVYETGFDTSKVTYNIYQQDPTNMTYSLIISELSFATRSYNVSVNPGKSFSYLIKPVYNQSVTTATDYKYVRDYPTTGPVVGSALSLVSNLKASQNTFNDKIEVNWNSVENANKYKVCYLGLEKETEDTRFTITDVPVNQYGSEITITVKVVDCAGTTSAGGTSTIGKILGGIVPTVNGNAKDIDVTWNEVAGATKYMVKVYSSLDSTAPIISTQINAGSDLSFKLTSDDVLNIEGLEDPLSRSYYFSVIPYVGGEASLAENKIEGHWLLAPKNVSATKAAYIDLTEISWEAVSQDITEYRVYYREVGSEFNINKYYTVPRNVTKYNHTNTNGIYEYAVAACYYNDVGPVSNNYVTGYPLMKPSQVICEDLGDFYKLSFKEVLGATDYRISFNGEREKYIVTRAQIEAAPSSPSTIVDGTIIKNAGLVSIYMSRITVTTSPLVNVLIAAHNENGLLPYRNTTEDVDSSFYVSQLNHTEIMNLTNTALNNIYQMANAYYEGDWWQGTNRKEYNVFGDNSVTFLRPSGLGSYETWPWENGTTTLKNYKYTTPTGEKFILSTVSGKELINKTESTYISLTTKLIDVTGKITISFPFTYGQYTIEYTNYKVNDPKSGNVKINDTIVDLSNVTERILQQ